MTIYQLHECGGQWEDHFDYIRGSYLHKDRAEEEKLIAEKTEQELQECSKRCVNCPFLDEDFADKDELLKEYNDYCDEADLVKSGLFDSIDCNNYASKWDDVTFYIEEVEVIE
jgi:hypothetical protein